eukprot:sb/3477928/
MNSMEGIFIALITTLSFGIFLLIVEHVVVAVQDSRRPAAGHALSPTLTFTKALLRRVRILTDYVLPYPSDPQEDHTQPEEGEEGRGEEMVRWPPILAKRGSIRA